MAGATVLIHTAQRHILPLRRKIKRGNILRQARQVLGLGNGNDPLLDIPAQQNLCRGLTVLACQILWQKRSFLPPFLPSWRRSSGSIALVQQILHQHTRHTIVHRNGDPVGFIHVVRRINALHTA